MMNWKQQEAFDRMLWLLKTAREQIDFERNNTILEAIAYGIGVLILKEEKHGKQHNGNVKRTETNGISKTDTSASNEQARV